MNLVFLIFATLFSISVFGAAKNRVYQGEYVWGAEVNTFSPCYSNKTYWVIAEKDIIEKLSQKHANLVQKPYQPIFISIRGEINNSKENLDGFASNYDGSISVLSIQFMKIGSKASCKKLKN